MHYIVKPSCSNFRMITAVILGVSVFKTITVNFIMNYSCNNTVDPHYNDSVCYQRFCCKIGFAVIKKLDMTHLKQQKRILLNIFFINHTFCVFVRITSPRRF